LKKSDDLIISYLIKPVDAPQETVMHEHGAIVEQRLTREKSMKL
jgi:hypothetical protein